MGKVADRQAYGQVSLEFDNNIPFNIQRGDVFLFTTEQAVFLNKLWNALFSFSIDLRWIANTTLEVVKIAEDGVTLQDSVGTEIRLPMGVVLIMLHDTHYFFFKQK